MHFRERKQLFSRRRQNHGAQGLLLSTGDPERSRAFTVRAWKFSITCWRYRCQQSWVDEAGRRNQGLRRKMHKSRYRLLQSINRFKIFFGRRNASRKSQAMVRINRTESIGRTAGNESMTHNSSLSSSLAWGIAIVVSTAGFQIDHCESQLKESKCTLRSLSVSIWE